MKHAALLFVLAASCFANRAYGVVVYNQTEYQCTTGFLQSCLVEANNQFLASVPPSQLKFTMTIDQSIYRTTDLAVGQYLIVTTQIVNTRIAARPITSLHFSVKTTSVVCSGGPCSSLAQQTESLISGNVAALGGADQDLVIASNTNFVSFHSECSSEWRVEIANSLWISECDPNIPQPPQPTPLCG